MSDERPALTQFIGPRFWPTWVGLGLVRLVCLLPYPLILMVGRSLGRLAFYVLADRRRIARRNLELCLPEIPQPDRERLLRAHFASLGIAVFEVALTWWARDARIEALAHVEGFEHVERALEAGRGAILLSAHFTSLEICGRVLAMLAPVHAVYRPHRNPLMDEITRRGRERSAEKTIPKYDIRQMIRALKANRAVWYAPDQAHHGKSAELVPLFGIPAQTNTATSRLARLTGAPVLPFLPWRDRNGKGYRVVIGPPLDNFPSGDDLADTLHFHELVEARVREVPEQYLWVHRRFKNLPDQPDLYAGIDD